MDPRAVASTQVHITAWQTRDSEWMHSLEAGTDGIIAPIRSGADFQTTLDRVNPTDTTCEIDVGIIDPTGNTVTRLAGISIPANRSLPVNDAVSKSLDIGAAIVHRNTACSIWTYASVIDNATHDPTTVTLDSTVTISLSGGGVRQVRPWPDWTP